MVWPPWVLRGCSAAVILVVGERSRAWPAGTRGHLCEWWRYLTAEGAHDVAALRTTRRDQRLPGQRRRNQRTPACHPRRRPRRPPPRTGHHPASHSDLRRRANTRGHGTDREREVLTLITAGLSNDQIAERLVLSPATARTHVSRIMTKVAARDRAQLVVLAYETGLVHPRHA
jgi:DNA-binding CsgD family transcriptional regulator